MQVTLFLNPDDNSAFSFPFPESHYLWIAVVSPPASKTGFSSSSVWSSVWNVYGMAVRYVIYYIILLNILYFHFL